MLLGDIGASARRRGFSIIYIPLILLLLVAFVAMAVDTGRIRLAKAQLQGAADASARAGVSGLPGFGIGGSSARAQLVAQANDVAETKVVFDTSADIEWGYWDTKSQTFFVINDNPLTFGIDEREMANAVHTHARAASARNTSIPLWVTPHVVTFDRKAKSGKLSTQSNLTTEAVAMIGGGPSNFGFVGIDSFTGNGTTHVKGSVATDGNIKLIGGATIEGDARAGMGPPLGTITVGDSGTITGWMANLDYELDPLYPSATMPTTWTAVPDAVQTGGVKEITLLGNNNPDSPEIFRGTFPNNLTKLTVNGYVKVYIDANVDLRGCEIINTQTPQNASKLEIIVVGNHNVNLGGTTDTYAHIYAPDSDVTVHGTPYFEGWIVGKTLTMLGTTNLVQDGSLNDTTAYKITLVQ